jgi:hypothetical protein
MLATIGIGLMLAWNFHIDRSYYANQGYSATTIETAYAEAAGTRSVPPIHAISAHVDASGRVALPGNRNDDLVKGYSQLACYQPLFGYRLERFPVETLHPGPALDAADGVLNLKNPACYVFPKANHCTPGDHFPASAQAEAAAFLDYRPFAFVMPGWQEAANWIGIASTLVTLAAVLTAAWRLGAAAVIADGLSRFPSFGTNRPR